MRLLFSTAVLIGSAGLLAFGIRNWIDHRFAADLTTSDSKMSDFTETNKKYWEYVVPSLPYAFFDDPRNISEH
jgi:hypothetical protein